MSKKEDFDDATFEAEALKQLQSGGKLEGRVVISRKNRSN